MTGVATSLSETIAAVYGAVGVRDGFSRALPRIRALLNGSSAMLFTPLADAEAGGFGFVDHVNGDLFREYRARVASNPVWSREAAKRGLLFTGSTLTDEALISRKALSNEPFYGEFLRPMDISRLCATVVVLDEDPVLPRTYLCVFGGVRARPFSEEQRRALELLSPHVLQALRLAHRLEAAEAARDSTQDALHKMNCGVVLFDKAKRALFLNGAAESMCDARNAASALKCSHGERRLRATQPRDDAMLQAALDRAVRTPAEPIDTPAASAPILLRCARGDATVLATVLPLPPRLCQFATRAAVAAAFIEELTASPAGSVLFSSVFGLTDAESRVAHALICGEHAAAIAGRFAVSVNTVRTHIKAIYEKTHTKGIASLIALLVRLGNRATAPYTPPLGASGKPSRKRRKSARTSLAQDPPNDGSGERE